MFPSVLRQLHSNTPPTLPSPGRPPSSSRLPTQRAPGGQRQGGEEADGSESSDMSTEERRYRDRKSARIQIMSDLHLELERQPKPGHDHLSAYQLDIPMNTTALALLGNIGTTADTRLFLWLKEQLHKFDTIFYVSGNHEAWGSTIQESADRIRSFARYVNADPDLGNLVYLNRTRYDVDPTLTILGCTLWSHLDMEEIGDMAYRIKDFRRIQDFSSGDFVDSHKRDLDWLNATVEDIARTEPHRNIVILTHYAPTKFDSLHPLLTTPGEAEARVVSASVTELTQEKCWKSGMVRLWCFGHSLKCCDYDRDGIRVYSNQRGTVEDVPDFDEGKITELTLWCDPGGPGRGTRTSL